MQLIGLGFLYLIAAWFIGWWPFDPMDSSKLLPLSEYERVKVNAYFYYPSNKEVYLGEMKGAASCGAAAYAFARQKNVQQSKWSYVCCTIRNGSSCYEKIR